MVDPVPIPRVLRRIAKPQMRDPVELLKFTIDNTTTFEEAATELGISTVTLYRWMKRLEVRRAW